MSPHIDAIVPAAGHSRRMGTAKPLLDIGGQPMLRAVVTSLRPGVRRVAVVTRSELAALLHVDDLPDVQIILNDVPGSSMIDSIRAGLIALRHSRSPSAGDGVLVIPGDQPGLSAADLQRCVQAFHDHGGVVVATRDQRQGHPLIFAAELADVVLSSVCDSGLRALKAHAPGGVHPVPCTSTAVVQDLNTPDDYARWHADPSAG